jgi:hypothetical protein
MQSMHYSLDSLRTRSGVYLYQARRSIWIHAAKPEDFEAARPILRWFRDTVSADRFVLTSNNRPTNEWLMARFPSDHVMAPPWNLRPFVDRFFRQLNPLMILCIREGNSVGSVALDYARTLGIPLVVIDVAAPLPPHLTASAALLCVRSSEIAERLKAIGVVASRINVTGELCCCDDTPSTRPADQSARLTIQALEPFVAAFPEPTKSWKMNPVRRNFRLHQFAQTRLGRAIAKNRSTRRLDSWEDLRSQLRNPKTILCLGNGPSSEDPRLFDIKYDALFRVNFRWLDRGVFTRPDMVFVGSPFTTSRVSSCVFGFRTIAWESEMMLRHLLLDLSLRRLVHFTYERVSPFLNDGAWSCAPTNGALMVATAVGLRPQRLILAGIDLFSDTRGRYPGDTVGENDYPQMHSRNVDVDVIARALADYRGETVIMNNVLRNELSARVHSSAMAGS